ncbi:ankyrin repeat domain-containing protein [Dentiradicibacter hellwigii]|uniref:Ankyrin repeat domain-containing protein n=1 Tax=Dentiradicibacter hellwigii TaxID=3149053 RepID=A0ABV4UEH4_9RHOO
MSAKYPATTFFRGHYLEMAKAIEANDIPRLERLAQGQDLTLKGEKDMSLIWFAILHEKFDAISALIRLGVNPDTQIAEGLGSALDAAFMKHDDIRYLKAMLDGGLDPNYKRPDNYTLMLQRGVAGGLEHVKLLLSRGTRINDRDNIGGTALYKSINRIEPDIAAYLIEHGADFNAATVNGVTPAWAISESIKEMRPGNPIQLKFVGLRDLLIKKGAKWPPLPPLEVRDQMRARREGRRSQRTAALAMKPLRRDVLPIFFHCLYSP